MIDFKLPLIVLREGKKYVAYSPALDLSTCADTYERGIERFEEIVEIFFEELEKGRNTKEVLEELGWTIKEDKIYFHFPSYRTRHTCKRIS